MQKYKTMNEQIRQQFPALQRLHNDKPLIFFDGPAGVQVPLSVIDSMSNYYKRSNANTHGPFITSVETDTVMDSARQSVATFLGAPDGHCISFGQNMTTLNFALSRAIGKLLQPGDEILITQLDHEGNRGPWLSLHEQGIIVREVKMRMDGSLNCEDLQAKLNDRTRLVAIGYASNIFGTVNDVALVRQMTHQAGAWLLVDAVHYAPHFPIDVSAIGCDFLLCSAYKFYGPHVGILYAKPGLLDRLPTYRLRTAGQQAPYSIETGTLNHAAIAGVEAAIRFMAAVGQGDDLRSQLLSAFATIAKHENTLVRRLYAGLTDIKGIEIKGPGMKSALRAPTLAITVAGKTPETICGYLAERNICAWPGHFYAIRAVEVMGLLEKGGVTRMGMALYNTAAEVDEVLAVMADVTASPPELQFGARV